ncbi:septum formation family protein [Actinoallomurus vinaceus]|uniref:septum formation family protein n=1 Tax=Actinoallomurus vinaceus TaxID=1080074 RepID=UPI0031E53A7D
MLAAVFATVGLIPVSLVFVIVAFQRVRRSTDRGAGLLFYALFMNLVALALIAWALDGTASDQADGSDHAPAALTLLVGQCYDQPHGEKLIKTSVARSCDEPHDGQVGAVFDASGDSWPGGGTIKARAEAECTKRMANAPSHQPDGVALEVRFVYPNAVAWRHGVRHVVCSIERKDGEKLTTTYIYWRDVDDLSKGDCFDQPMRAALYSVTVMGCSAPHQFEVTSTFSLPDGAWPGLEKIKSDSEKGCRQGLPKHDASGHPVSLRYIHPTEESWKLGDRLVVCSDGRKDHKKLTAAL